MKGLVCLLCSGFGYLLAKQLPDGPWAAYVPLLVSYHLFLAYLAFTENQKTGLSMPIGQTVITHSAFLALLISLAVGRHYVPFFGLIRIFIPALAPFEATWLFSGGRPRKPKEEASPLFAPIPEAEPALATACASAATTVSAGTVSAGAMGSTSMEDYDAFLVYLRAARRPFRKPGITIQDEYKLWYADRVKQRT